jgi:hypothetical protein
MATFSANSRPSRATNTTCLMRFNEVLAAYRFFSGFTFVPAFRVARFTFPLVLQLLLKLWSGVDLR